MAAAPVDAKFSVLTSADRAGRYKPHMRPHRPPLEKLDVATAQALCLAGSPYESQGASGVGMSVSWHDGPGLPQEQERDVLVLPEAGSLPPRQRVVLDSEQLGAAIGSAVQARGHTPSFHSPTRVDAEAWALNARRPRDTCDFHDSTPGTRVRTRRLQRL